MQYLNSFLQNEVLLNTSVKLRNLERVYSLIQPGLPENQQAEKAGREESDQAALRKDKTGRLAHMSKRGESAVS